MKKTKNIFFLAWVIGIKIIKINFCDIFIQDVYSKKH